jgi:hypothetical protein
MSKGHGRLQRAILDIIGRQPADTPYKLLPTVVGLACKIYSIGDERRLALTAAQYNAVTRALRSLERRGAVKYAWYPKRVRLVQPEDIALDIQIAGLQAVLHGGPRIKPKTP